MKKPVSIIVPQEGFSTEEGDFVVVLAVVPEGYYGLDPLLLTSESHPTLHAPPFVLRGTRGAIKEYVLEVADKLLDARAMTFEVDEAASTSGPRRGSGTASTNGPVFTVAALPNKSTARGDK